MTASATAENEFGREEQLVVVSPDEFGIPEWGDQRLRSDLAADPLLAGEAERLPRDIRRLAALSPSVGPADVL
jgi:hypothetical protein